MSEKWPEATGLRAILCGDAHLYRVAAALDAQHGADVGIGIHALPADLRQAARSKQTRNTESREADSETASIWRQNCHESVTTAATTALHHNGAPAT